MSWDPSMSTTSCRFCGKGIEAWFEICEDCEEKELKLKMDVLKTKMMMDGKVYVKDEDLDSFKELLKEKDIPFFEYRLMKDKSLLELDTKKIIKQLFGDE